MGAVGIICYPVRLIFYLVLLCILYPLMLLIGILRALFMRIVKGNVSQILESGGGTPEVGPGKASAVSGGYWGQVVHAKPFDDKAKVEKVFKELLAEAGQEGDVVTVEWEEEESGLNGTKKKFEFGKIEPDHYAEAGSNWCKVALAKGDNTRLRIFNRPRGEPTVVQFFLPGSSFDGSSCFNIMKEFYSRYYGYPKRDVFMTGRTKIKPESAKNVDAGSFCGFLCRLPCNTFLNTSGLCWSLCSMSGCCGGPGAFQPEISLIDLDEETSTKLAERCRERGVKPFAAMSWAAVQGYYKAVGKYPSCIIQQCNLQRQHFDPPNANRDWVGDWLFAPLQYVVAPYTLEQANMGYKNLMSDIGDGHSSNGNHGPSGTVLRAFQAKAWGLMQSGAAAFEPPPNYNDPNRVFNSAVFFNNYGVRTVVPEAEVVHWNWAAPFDMGCNCIQVNGCTTMAFASMNHGKDGVQTARNHAYDLLSDIITGKSEAGETKPLLP